MIPILMSLLPISQYAISGMATFQSRLESNVTLISSGALRDVCPRKETKKEGPPNSMKRRAMLLDVNPIVRKGLLM